MKLIYLFVTLEINSRKTTQLWHLALWNRKDRTWLENASWSLPVRVSCESWFRFSWRDPIGQWMLQALAANGLSPAAGGGFRLSRAEDSRPRVKSQSGFSTWSRWNFQNTFSIIHVKYFSALVMIKHLLKKLVAPLATIIFFLW